MTKGSSVDTASQENSQSAATQPAFAMLSHRGRVRRTNEDACGARVEAGVFAVCDGMGGAAAGEIASELALETFLDTLVGSGEKPEGRMRAAIEAANAAVFAHSQKSRNLHGMGTTLVALLIESPERVWLGHVGDSRCYLLRSGKMCALTRDHSLVEEQIAAGLLAREEAGTSPIRNVITRAIGSQRTVDAEIVAHEVVPGDLFLLASDGLTRELSEGEIEAILFRATLDQAALEAACQALIGAANEKGGGDNITVLLVCMRSLDD